MECGYSTNPADRLNEAVISRFFRIESYAALSRPLSRPPTSKRAAVSSCPHSGHYMDTLRTAPTPQLRRELSAFAPETVPEGVRIGLDSRSQASR
jgi:hypothetical protein